jgi:hypothetical protein
MTEQHSPSPPIDGINMDATGDMAVINELTLWNEELFSAITSMRRAVTAGNQALKAECQARMARIRDNVSQCEMKLGFGKSREQVIEVETGKARAVIALEGVVDEVACPRNAPGKKPTVTLSDKGAKVAGD